MSALRTAKRRMSFLSLVLVFVVILSTEARAGLYTFDVWEPITNNSDYEVEFAQGLSLEVTDDGMDPGEVLFKFFNNSTIDPDPGNTGTDTVGPGSITDIYFDDGALDAIVSIPNPNPSYVFFDSPASPGNVPGWNTVNPPFDTSTDGHYSADSTNAPLGADPGEYVEIVFDFQGGKTFSDVIDAIYLGFTDPADYTGGNWYDDSLRIALHVSNLGLDNNDDEPGDYSDGFIMTPIPSAVLLGMLGMGVAGLKLRRFT